MSDVGKPPGDAIDLRNQAEALVRGKATASPEAPEVDVSRSPLDAQKLLHELQVHQIELELQNEELRRSQLELETERIRYFDLYNLAPVGYCTLDEKSVVIEANLTAASLFGVTRNALVQCPLSRFIQAKDLGLFHRHTTRLLETGETQAWDMRLLKTNGTPWWGHVVATATQDTEGAAVVRLAVTDLTQRKQAEEALREVENRFSMAIAAVEDGIWDWNVITGNAFFSASYYRTLGYEDSEFQANYANWRLLVHPEDLARVEGDLLDAVASGQGFSIDLRMRMKSGNWRWVVTRGRAVELGADGKAQRMIGTMSDITERKKAEAALLESEERWKFAIEGAGDGLWDWNVQTGEAYYSPRYKEMLGYTDADFGAASDEWSKRIHPDDAPGVFAGLQPYMEGKPGTADVEFRMLCKDGTWRWMQGRGLVVSRDTDGKPLRMIGTNADITERKQAKDMLTQSEARHSSMVANISDVIGIIGVDGIMKYKSPNIQKWFGWEPQDLIGTDGWLTVHPDDLERIQHEFQTILEQDGASAEVEYRYKCKDGSYKYIALTAINLINDPAIAGVLLNYYDVTDRKQAGEALRESEHNFRGMFENSADGILLVSLDGHVRDANPMACKMNGYTHHEFVGMHGSEFVHPDHVWQFRDSIAATQAGESYKAESVNLRKNGTPLPIEVRITPFTHQGEPVLLCNIHDITEHKLAAEALKKSEKDYRTLINNLSSGVVVHGADTSIQLSNLMASSLLGLTEDQMRGKTAIDPRWCFLNENRLPLPLEQFPVNRVIGAGEGFHGQVLGVCRPDRAEPTWVLCSGYPVKDEVGNLLQVVITFNDITARKQLDEERANLQAQLQQSQKMESLGTLAGGVAHDMNNVLGAILGLASAHIGSQPPGSPLHQALDTICKATERGGKMVRGLLSFARQSPAENLELDMNAILREQVGLLERTTLAKVRLQMDLEPDLRPILGDTAALIHAFMNLCVNAVDAMPENETLTLRTRNVDNDWIEVVVEDNGIGMPKEVLEKAMDPFFTTKETGKGTGLGLSMVFSTVKAHGGQMAIQSHPGQGTLVMLRFPACEKKTQVAPLAVTEATLVPKGTMKVLLVDDDELIQISTQILLETIGHTVNTAQDGEEALAMLEAGFEPDLVILDMNMPGLGGIGTLPRLRMLRPEVPVLLATGRVDQIALTLVSANPGVSLLSKPFGLRELQKHIESIGLG